ncbi:MAG: glycosyltransferase, partial [Cohaesibacter sp.]|nr:glycosyltransferase [Cohaesibacter sp.]
GDLPSLFAGARLFTFPSHYEGFGLPVLEAMASGTPVVTSERSSLPEVGGDAVAYVDPDDIGDIAQKIELGLMDDEWQKQAILSGLQQAQKFSWKRCAQETMQIYRKAHLAHDKS